jgi:hypothetical protein
MSIEISESEVRATLDEQLAEDREFGGNPRGYTEDEFEAILREIEDSLSEAVYNAVSDLVYRLSN